MFGRSRRGEGVLVGVLTWHLAVALVGASTAHAQAPSPSQAEVDRAVALGREGREHYEAGRFVEALERFRAADRIARSPVLVLYIARCERNLGRLVAAREAYRRATEQPLAPDAPAPFVAARSEAERELADLEARLPRVQIAMPAGAAPLRVTLDGVVVETAERAAPIAVDPGEHTILATGDGGVRLERRFRATEGGALVTIDLSEAPPPKPEAKPAAQEPRPSRSGGTVVPGIIALGFGAAGLGVGIATGLVASSKTSDIESRCDGASCLASDQPLADEASTFATVSTIGFIVGGVGVASGVVLLVAFSGDGGGSAASEPPTTVGIGLSPAGFRGVVRF